MNLKELRQKRLKYVEIIRENGFEDGIKRLLTDLYPDNAHFIYELLQNAEDARATEVRFILKEDSVEFEHNGDRLFSFADVESITGIADSTKRDDPTNIGKFGIGFKAVFAYTATPEIASGEFHFRIRDLVVPDRDGLAPCSLGEKETRFTLPFDNPQKPPQKARAEIEANLRQLDESTLLFLSNIQKIEYLLPDETLGFLERKKTDESRIEILVQHPEDAKPDSVFFLRFKKEVSVNDENDQLKPCRIAVAFGLEKTQARNLVSSDGWKIKRLDQGQVCIYFPAEKETSNLRFHLHAPFASTVARDSVRDCPANDELRDHLANLIAESMTTIRDQGLLTVGFLATLPNESDNLSSFYTPIMKRLIRAFQQKNLTPMKQGGHKAANGTFRGSARLSDLISDNDLATLLGGAYSPPLWISNPPQRNQREDNFLSMLDISEWTIEDLVNELSADSETIMEWMAKKSDGWHQKLYALLGDFLSNASSDDATDQETKLKQLRIVRCSDVTYKIGRDSYFPSDGVEHDKAMPRVAKGVYLSGNNKREKEKARKFLADIGVREVGEVERVEAILKQRYSKGSIKPRKQDLKRFIDLVEKEPKQAELFSDYYIFHLENGKWGKPRIVFLDSPYLATGLKTYYKIIGEDPDRKRTLSPNYQESGIELERLGKFAKAVGAQTKLNPKKQCIPHEHPEWNKLRDFGGWSQKYGRNEDYDMPEFDRLLTEPNLSKSKLIWDTMNQLSDDCDCLKASYRSNSRHYTKTADSTLVHKLKENEWVPQKQKGQEEYIFLLPIDATAELLPKGFSYEPESEWLEAIEFGKIKRELEAEEEKKREQATQEYQSKNAAAEMLGFPSPEEAQDMAKILEDDPEFIQQWKDKKQRVAFPESPTQAPERRRKRISEQYGDAPKKEYELRERSDRTSRGAIDPTQQLREQYTNEDGQMICQICEKEMPFKKRDGEYYFEAVEAFSKDYLPKEHEVQFLALCPVCAARYKEFVKNDEDAMSELHRALKQSDELEVPLTLGEWETSIRFVETHRIDMKTILQQER